MTFTTKLNIGDTIWHISKYDGCVKEITITDITVTCKSHTDANQCGYKVDVLYGTDDNCAIFESTEGKYWWRTGTEIMAHLNRTVKAKPNKEMGDKFTKAFEKLFNPDLTPKPSDDAFNEFFGPASPVIKTEKVRISLPPKPRPYKPVNELSRLADEL